MEIPQEKEVVQSLRLSRVIVPIMIGLAAVIYLLYTQFDIQRFREIAWNTRAFLWIGLAFLLLILRHFSYALRMNAITGFVFSWR